MEFSHRFAYLTVFPLDYVDLESFVIRPNSIGSRETVGAADADE